MNVYSRMLAALMESIPDSVYFKEPDGRFIMVSKAKADNSLTTSEKMIGKTDFDFLPEEEARKSFCDDDKVMITGQPLRDKLEKLTRRDGKEIWVSVSKTPWMDESVKAPLLKNFCREFFVLKM